jgi:hypothetical protein
MPSVHDIPTGEAPDELVPDPQVDPKLAELGWEPPVKIRKRNYRRRRPLEKFKVALRNFGITAVRGSPRSNGARPPRDDGQRE